MNKAEELILKYEQVRQEIKSLKDERVALIYECSHIEVVDNGMFKDTKGDLCLSRLWNQSETLYEDGFASSNYELAIEEFGCAACNNSFSIKRGLLADAKQRFGQIKRNIAFEGKKLIKENS